MLNLGDYDADKFNVKIICAQKCGCKENLLVFIVLSVKIKLSKLRRSNR